MSILLTSDSPKAAGYATGLFTDWLGELDEGPLRTHIADLAQTFQDMTEDELVLCLEVERATVFSIYGYRLIDVRCELVGPYVPPKFRRNGLGGTRLRTACRQAMTKPDLYLLAPVSEQWMIPSLERLGFHPVAPYLPGGAGDHRAFHANQAERAALFLGRHDEPRGKGDWAVRLLNDDDTPFEFVSMTLAHVLDVATWIAWEYALLIHHTGQADIRYCRTQRGANKLAERIRRFARMNDVPLRAAVARR